MGNTAAKKKTTSTEISAQDFMSTIDIKQRFIGDALSLGWRLAVTFIVPVLIGVLLDRHFKTKPTYTLIGMIIAVLSSIVIIRQTVKEVNDDLAVPAKKRKKNV